jgi:hypothetical protein
VTGESQRDASVRRRFGAFVATEGLAPTATASPGPALVATFLAVSCRDLCAHTLGTYRSVLARESEASTTTERGFSGSPAPRPYSRGEIASLRIIVASQSNENRVGNATVALAGTLGAGLAPRELAQLRGPDVSGRDSVCWVSVRGARSRLVDVADPDARELVHRARHRPDYLFRPGARVRTTKNLVSEVCAGLVRDPGHVAFSPARARASFICALWASETPLRQICVLAGLRDVDSLLRYAVHVPSAPQTKAALRWAARA